MCLGILFSIQNHLKPCPLLKSLHPSAYNSYTHAQNSLLICITCYICTFCISLENVNLMHRRTLFTNAHLAHAYESYTNAQQQCMIQMCILDGSNTCFSAKRKNLGRGGPWTPDIPYTQHRPYQDKTNLIRTGGGGGVG